MLHAVIMAGGSGTRFWPESRDDRPKQLLRLLGERTMIQSTVDRLAGLVPRERVMIVTNRRQAAAIADQLPDLDATSILAEPCKRDTAPCIALAAAHLVRRDPQAIMAVMPSDHVIQPTERFQQAMRLAEELVRSSPRRIVTLGIRPTYPAESFGYIERGELLAISTEANVGVGVSATAGDVSGGGTTGGGVAAVYRVARFREKPKAEAAREFLDSGRFFWNAGIFIWRAGTILESLERLQPGLHGHIRAIASTIGTAAYGETLEREFAAIRGISIDYAVMEHADDVAVIEAPFEWDDVGSWQSLARLAGQDGDGNTIAGKHLGLRTRGTIVRTDGDHLVVTVGLEDCIVVHTPDATLVARKQDEEAIREVAKKLAELGWREFL